MHLFHKEKLPAPLVEMINWKAVHFQKIIADSKDIKNAYRVVVNGTVIGAIGQFKNSIFRSRAWIWVENNQSFTQFRYDELSYNRRWAATSLIFKLRKDGVLN
jgi:hypothetical protein